MIKLRPEERQFIDKLYDSQRNMLFNYALSRLGDEEMAQEVVQETFRIACNKIQAVMENSNPAGWLIRALQNVMKKAIGNKQETAKYIAELPDDLFMEDARLVDEDIDLLYSDLVSNADFQLVKKFAVERKTIKDIAQEAEISISACKQRLSRAKKRLRELIEKQNK